MAVALLAPAAPAAPAPAQAVPQSVALGAAQALGGAQPVALVAVPAVRVGVVTGELVQMATGALEGAAQPWLCWDAVTVGAVCPSPGALHRAFSSASEEDTTYVP